ncbi:DUF5957 family protein [Paenibacillus alkalitolerans]|uniref:DUF5957 family protein n=1 Tax=Paenibacillus alkalitolerans TaxID=2799335 RepID=UPI0018F57C0B|nr:DUF5957 family protein [Paenibacillus alkalitolerans]
MKSVLYCVLGLIVGFIGGLVASEAVAVIGVMLFDRPIWLRWLRFVPFIAAVACAVAAPVMLRRRVK